MSDNMNKEPEEQRETCSQFKRRRLQFDTHVEDSPFCDEDLTSVFLKSNVSVAYLSIMTKPCSYFNLLVVYWEVNGLRCSASLSHQPSTFNPLNLNSRPPS